MKYIDIQKFSPGCYEKASSVLYQEFKELYFIIPGPQLQTILNIYLGFMSEYAPALSKVSSNENSSSKNVLKI